MVGPKHQCVSRVWHENFTVDLQLLHGVKVNYYDFWRDVFGLLDLYKRTSPGFLLQDLTLLLTLVIRVIKTIYNYLVYTAAMFLPSSLRMIQTVPLSKIFFHTNQCGWNCNKQFLLVRSSEMEHWSLTHSIPSFQEIAPPPALPQVPFSPTPAALSNAVPSRPGYGKAVELASAVMCPMKHNSTVMEVGGDEEVWGCQQFFWRKSTKVSYCWSTNALDI